VLDILNETEDKFTLTALERICFLQVYTKFYTHKGEGSPRKDGLKLSSTDNGWSRFIWEEPI